MNVHRYVRQGVSFLEMSEAQRAAAFGLLRASLSAKGLKLSQDIMKLNHTLGELNNNNFTEYGEWLYHITVMGEPSATKPWGWQIDGHHLIINYFVLGDQVVMRSLDEGQRKQAILDANKPGNNNYAEGFKDNAVVPRTGVLGANLNAAQRKELLALVELFVDNMDGGHAQVKMAEVRAHLEQTSFAWVGGTADDSVYYYRIHSPVVLIEFDHQRPANTRHLQKNPQQPIRDHIHVVVRTPNGNDYGKDLLRQHLLAHPH